MKLFYALFLSFGLSFQSNAQVSYGGEPSNWSDKTVSSDIPFIRTSPIDVEALAAEDAVVDQYKEAPYRFGVEHEVHYTPENSGNWTISSHSSTATWQLGIECPGARSINLLFSTYKLPKGAKLFIWSTDREEYLGSFTSENNNENNLLATTVLQSGKVVVEYTLPLEAMGEGQLEIGQIVHGYRPVLMNHFAESVGDRGPYGTSGACNNNINCPEGADWQVEKRAVAIILSGGSALCTGALVNNTANDGTPYFLTANHCYSNNVGSWVFIFNHESATCDGTTGPTNQSFSGSTLKAKNQNSDFCLLLLNSTPPANYNVEYAGWDASDNPTGNTSVVGIHHPSGDIKKISFENDPVTQGTWGSPTAQTWDVAQWDNGITEPGSSGSPLFNQNHRIIGQLFGGGSACNGAVENGQGDSYGRFGVSWAAGGTPDTQLMDWLDPQGTGNLVINGYPDVFVTAAIDAQASSITGVGEITCDATVTPSITITNGGSDVLTSMTITYSINGGTSLTQEWTGSLTSGATATVALTELAVVSGANVISVTLSNPNGVTDQQLSNNTTTFTVNAISAAAATAVPDLNNFDNSAFPYSGWQISNPDGSTTWTYTTTTVGGGVLFMDCFNYNAAGEVDEVITAPYNLSGQSTPSLSFDVAYRQYNDTYTDGMGVSISTSCSGPWTQVWSKADAELATVAASTTEYSDVTDAADWRTECIDLSAYAGQGSVFVKFTCYNGYGNDLYIDNVSVSNTACVTGVEEVASVGKVAMNVYPNPTSELTTLSYRLAQSARVQYEIVNILGEKLWSKDCGNQVVGSFTQVLDMSELASGIYLVNLKVDGVTSTERVIVK